MRLPSIHSWNDIGCSQADEDVDAQHAAGKAVGVGALPVTVEHVATHHVDVAAVGVGAVPIAVELPARPVDDAEPRHVGHAVVVIYMYSHVDLLMPGGCVDGSVPVVGSINGGH